MITYQYQIIRYVHDQFTGEFINVGIIIYAPERQFLQCKTTSRYTRITSIFPEANGRHIVRQLKLISSEISKTSERLSDLFKPSDHLEILTSNILPPDDSAIQLSSVELALDIDLFSALNSNYKDLVEKYEPTKKNRSLTDEDIWKEKYKRYFDKYKISKKLVKHEVVTDNDIFSFTKAWKNEIWHCFQPVSFELQEKDSIKSKVYSWSGKLTELRKSNEKMHLTFLTALSTEHESMTDFINEYLNQDSETIEVDVVLEKDAEIWARKTSKYMAEHS